MIIDPSRVLLLGEYATLAESGSETELGAREAEVRLFIEALWSAAGAAGRQQFMEAVAGQSSEMPWVAVRVPEPIEAAEGRAPPVVGLLTDTKPLGDEGVAGHRLDAESEAGARGLTAIRAWDWDLLERIASPSGWRLEATDDVSPETPETTRGNSDGDHDESLDPAPQAGDPGEPESGGALVLPDDVTATSPWIQWALAVGGIGVVGTALMFTVDRKE